MNHCIRYGDEKIKENPNDPPVTYIVIESGDSRQVGEAAKMSHVVTVNNEECPRAYRHVPRNGRQLSSRGSCAAPTIKELKRTGIFVILAY